MKISLLAAIALISPLFAQEGFKPLFNGKNLDDFIVDTQGLWRVENGEIIGVSPGLKYNDFLRTKKTYTDFVLKVSFKMRDTSGKGNSGIQFRSEAIPGSHEVKGYQADVGMQYWGCLYDESRRNRILAQASPEALASVKKDDWNEYIISAQGARITLTLNGVVSVDYTETEPDILRTGFIALQLHSGPPFEMRFRNLMIRELVTGR